MGRNLPLHKNDFFHNFFSSLSSLKYLLSVSIDCSYRLSNNKKEILCSDYQITDTDKCLKLLPYEGQLILIEGYLRDAHIDDSHIPAELIDLTIQFTITDMFDVIF